MISLKRLAGWVQWLTLFVIWTLILYHVVALFSSWLEPSHRYGEPKGRAIKVFSPIAQQETDAMLWVEIGDRLRLFYQIGE